LIFTGIILCLIGFIIIFLGSLGTVSVSSGNISTGGVIFIGPFPIAFGAGEYGLHLIWLSIVIAIIMIALSYLFIKKLKNI
ncbi:MAG: TIGR00304 family membrane protein, partial [Nitrososphaeria archaeon]